MIDKKPVHPENVTAETRGREWPDGTQPGAQSDECTELGRAEYVKCSTDYRIQLINKHEHNKPENVSLTHLARNFQKQV